jgi:hypothetical protein
MTQEEVSKLRVTLEERMQVLTEFYPLFRKKHERWTAEAYEKAVEGVAEVLRDLLEQLEAGKPKLEVVG